MVYNRALARAGRAHDKAVVGAASSRDQSVLSALDALLGAATPTGSTAPAFTAAEAAPIRAAVAKLRGVVTATTTVLNKTVNAAGTFLVQTVNHSTALARAVNQADGAFFGSVIAAETASLVQAFDIRHSSRPRSSRPTASASARSPSPVTPR